MNDNQYAFLPLEYQRKKHSDYNNNDFGLQKYEIFKPKEPIENYNNKSLKGAENKVKNLLSAFLKIEKKNSESGFDSPNQKFKEDYSHMESNINKREMKKVLSTEFKDNEKQKLLKSNSCNESNNKRSMAHKKHYKENSGDRVFNFYNISKKRKEGFNLNPLNFKNEHIFTWKKAKSKNTIDNNILEEGLPQVFKQKTNQSNHKAKSPDILGRNKTNDKLEKKENNNLVPIKISSKTFYSNHSKSLIKKAKSFHQNNNTYLNFKKDKDVYFLNKSNKGNFLSLNTTMKNRINVLKNKRKNKLDIFNDFKNSSYISDCSGYSLNQRSFYINNNAKNGEAGKKSSNAFNKYLTNSNNRKIPNHFITLSDENFRLRKSLTSKRTKSITKLKSKKDENYCIEINNRNNSNIKIIRLNTQIKSLKEQLKHSISLHPEELEMSLIDEKKNNKINNKYFNQYKTINSSITNNKLKLLKSNKSLQIEPSLSNKNLEKIQKLNIIKKESIDNKMIEKVSSGKKNIMEKIPIIENKSTIKSIKSLKSSILDTTSKNSSFEDYSFYSIKRKSNYNQKYRILVHKKNIYDSLDDEEIEDEEEIYRFYILPNSYFSIIFDSILFILTIISLILVPFYLAINHKFCRNSTITIVSYVNFIIELINIIDLFLGFFRAYYDWDEQLINKNKMIGFKYLAGWFIFDLLASIPVYTIITLYEPKCENIYISSNYKKIFNNLYYLLISNRLLKVFKIFMNNQAWKKISNKLNDYGFIGVYTCLVLATINYTSCLYIFIGRNSYPNWIYHSNLDNKSFISLYVCAIYILIMALTTVGYGDITCYSMNEMIFQLLILIIGIICYSYVVSLLSNYAIKINEKSVEFDKKVAILKEIKKCHPKFPEDLYNRIVRYLKFKHFHEKKFKHIIFDSLPVGLKNNLVLEMYKPIIKKFIFFKNFQNSDFIVHVVLAFKPIVAYKNDILVNDGDMVEDIMFVKKGSLSVELPINTENKQENIDKYLKKSILNVEKEPIKQMIENKTLISGDLAQSIEEQDKNTRKSLSDTLTFLNIPSSLKYSTIFNKRTYQIEKEKKEKAEKEKQRKKNITYVKVFRIRENEHFGDILMFLAQRSPLRVRVKSIKCELFFLKKIDAVKISTNYQNIWKEINKKSILNFEQMKKSIKNIVEIFCEIKSFKSHDESNENEENLENKNKKENNSNRRKSDINCISLNTIREEPVGTNESYNSPRINYAKFFKNVEKKEDLILDDDNNIQNNNLTEITLKNKYNLNHLNSNNKLALSLSNISLPPSLAQKSSKSSKSLSNINVKNKHEKKKSIFNKANHKKQNNNNNNKAKKSKFEQKVLDAFNGNYKFYKGMKTVSNRENKKVTIISEESELDGTNMYFKNSNIKMSNFSNKKHQNFSSKNDENSKQNEVKVEKAKDYESNISWENVINKELLPGEMIKVNKGDNLFEKKFDMDFISTKESDIINNETLKFRNTKIQILLKPFEEEKQNMSKKKNTFNSKEGIINEKSKENSINTIMSDKQKSNKNIEINFENISGQSFNSSYNCASPINSKIDKNKKINWHNKTLSINNNISFQLQSSYENFNLISGEQLIKNKELQIKLKKHLLNEISKLSSLSHSETDSDELKKNNSLKAPLQPNEKKDNTFHFIKPSKRKSTPVTFKVSKFKKGNDIFLRRKTIDSFSKVLSHSSSMKENISLKPKINNGLENDLNNTIINNRFTKNRMSQQGLLNRNRTININNISHINNSILDLSKKKKGKRNSSLLSPSMKAKKKNDNLLSKINFNIQKTNQNLNNPEEFYSNYFNSILEGKESKKNKKVNSLFFFNSNEEMNK